MFLGIEIGGTKLQLGVGGGDGRPPAVLERLDVEPKHGAEGIRRRIEEAARRLIAEHDIRAVGFGFGGPVDAAAGRVWTSHQIEGWKDFPLVAWAEERLGRPALLANDSDCGGLAEARFGAGRGERVVFYNNIGSGVGGALVIGGRLYEGGNGIAAEFGHLRPGLFAERPEQDLESTAAGWAITASVCSRLMESLRATCPCCAPPPSPADETGLPPVSERDCADLLERCDGRVDRIDTKLIAEAALAGNSLAKAAFDRAAKVVGWGFAQVITLLTPNVIVMGGGVSLVDDSLLLGPVRQYVDRYVFPPFVGGYRIERAQLGEAMVVYGALALAVDRFGSPA